MIGNLSKISENLKDENYTIGESGKKVFAKGNQIGRMKKKGFTLTDLNKVVVEYEKTHDQLLLKHYIEQLFTDNRLLDKYIDRNIPPTIKNELTGKDGGPITYIEHFPALNPETKEEK